MGLSWEEMCQQVVIDGRPGDVASAALGWSELLKNLRSVQESLEKNVADLGTVWKGPAYEAFKSHIDEVAKSTGRLIDDAEKDDGIVHALNNAADRLTEAQRNFPIPASCFNDVLEARNGHVTIGIGLFEAKVKPDFLGLLDPLTSLADWLNDRTDEAAKVYERVNDQYQEQAPTMPGEVRPGDPRLGRDLDTPLLDTGNPSVPKPTLPNTVPPGTPDLPEAKRPDLTTPTPDLDRTPPDLDRNPPGFDRNPPGISTPPGLGGTPGTDGLDDRYGSGLASAAGSLTTGAGGGLPSTAGLGSGLGSGGGLGGGAGAGPIPGGGALGRPVAPVLPPMMGGGAAGGGRGAGGRLGAGGRPGVGMMPAGMMGGAGGGPGARGGGATAAGGRGVAATAAGGRGGLVGGAGGGAGYGEEETARNTWLEEDDDVWGAGDDSPPGVLR